MDPDGENIVGQIVVLIGLTLVNAFFAGAEMATVSVNKNKINMLAEEGNKKARLILTLLEEPTKFLSTIQVAITLSGFFASASAATGISKVMAEQLAFLKIPYTNQISFVSVTIILSYFTLVFGELVPKRIALQKAEVFSMFAIRPIAFVSKIASPFIRFLTFSTNITLKLLGMKSENLEEEISKEEIKSLVEQGKEQGVFNKIEQEIINSIFEFDDKLAREIMTPRINVFAIDITEPIEEYIEELFTVTYSRIPVYEEEIDNIIGVLYIKDFFREARKVGYENVDIRSILHKPYLVPESKNIDELFKEMQHQKKYFAILIDEYGEFSGIVSIEDLVEEIMGDIEDEYDKNGPQIVEIDASTYLIDGLITVDEINSKLNLEIESENYDTISGLLIDTMGAIPKEDDTRKIELEGLVFELVCVKEKRIDKVKLYLPKKEEQEKIDD
jgi:putative hemolysin